MSEKTLQELEDALHDALEILDREHLKFVRSVVDQYGMMDDDEEEVVHKLEESCDAVEAAIAKVKGIPDDS